MSTNLNLNQTTWPAAVALGALGLLALPGAASTYRMVADERLERQAKVVVEATVADAQGAPTDAPATDYFFEVERVLKGDLSGGTVVVRVPGGVGADGVGLKVWGAPSFAPGERALLFLIEAEDGSYRILHLMLGAFHERLVGGRRLAIRDLSEAHALEAKGGAVEPAGRERDFSRFADWLAERADGAAGDPDYRVEVAPGELAAAERKYTLLATQSGGNFRWFDFDRGRSVYWRVHSRALPALGLLGTIDAFGAALEAWNTDPETNVSYRYDTTTEATSGFGRTDGRNVVMFGDPNNEIPGTYSCSGGGVVALGGSFYTPGTRSYNSKPYHEAVEAEVVTNDGSDCLLDDPAAAAEVFTHELGHTLGLGHSAERNAAMWPTAHNDGRGARPSGDDWLGIDLLYGDGVREVVEDPTGGEEPSSPPTAPAALQAVATSKTSIALTWKDTSSNEESFVVEVKTGKGFAKLGSVPAEAVGFTVTGLKAGKAYVFRVCAVNAGGTSASSNKAKARTPK